MSEGTPDRIQRDYDRWLLYALVAIVIALLVNAMVAAAPECQPIPQIQIAEKHQHDSNAISNWVTIAYSPFCSVGSFVITHKDVVDGLSTFIIAIFTVILAWSTIRLWLSHDEQAGLTRKAIEESKTASAQQSRDMQAWTAAAQKSADASDLQAKAMIASFRALIQFTAIPRIIRPFTGELFKPGSLYDVGILLIPVHNAGARPATIIGVDMNWTIAPEPPAVPQYHALATIHFTIQQGQIIEIPIVDRPCSLSKDMIDRIRKGELWWYYGYFRYRDFMDDLWDVGFVGHWEECQRPGFPMPRGVVTEAPTALFPTYLYARKVSNEAI